MREPKERLVSVPQDGEIFWARGTFSLGKNGPGDTYNFFPFHAAGMQKQEMRG